MSLKKYKYIICLIVIALLLIGCIQYTPPLPVTTPRTTITILHGYSTTDLGIEDMITQKISSEFPDVRLEWDNVSWGDYFSSEMQARIASGDVPDIIIGKAQDVSSFQASGFLSSFDDSFTGYIEQKGLDSVTINGSVYGIPYDMLYQGVIYNRRIFEEHGLTVPRTTQELKYVVDYLNDVGITPFAAHFVENWYAGNIKMQFALNRVFSENPVWGDEFRAGTRNYSNFEEMIRCFEDVKYVFDNSWADSLLVTQRECLRRFSNGEAAMFVTGTWSVQPLHLIYPEMEVGIFPFPDDYGAARLIFEPNTTFMSNARSEKKELANRIILAIISDKELAASVSTFTQTQSLVGNVESDSLSMVREDLNYFMNNDRLIDVSVWNTQLAWIFQDMVARQTNLWLDGRLELSYVLAFADTNRSFSKW